MSNILRSLQNRHITRIKTDKNFQALLDDIAESNRLRKKNLISLNEAERRQDREAQAAKLAAREAGRKKGISSKELHEDDGLQANERNISSEIATEKKLKNAKDILLIEAAHVVSDEIGLLQSKNISKPNLNPKNKGST